MKIKSITVTLLAPMTNHAANRGEKLLGNASSIKRRPDGRVYISGQMQRHVLFSAIERMNEDDPKGKGTYVANGDGTSTDIEIDLRSDLGGYLATNKDDYSGRRTAPISATPAVAQQISEVGRDLLVRLKMNEDKDSTKKQALATNEYSESDLMQMSFHLDVSAVGITKLFEYDKEAHIGTSFEDHLANKPNERKRRIVMFLDATRSMTDYANQARNATTGEPQKVLIVLDNKMSRKASRYFSSTSDIEKERILLELSSRNAVYFLGDDTDANVMSVNEAYQKAFEAMETHELYNPAQ
jgi:CRISPR-associated protein Cst2